ncbi:MAG: aminotransferase class III-fold pyridoxal phosphate-dependent enzyme [Phycisphaeraceae bacterium]|nr:aminotransferase class III-fold pyridoxal phosphate-dependent enzyme [Phycisphaerales bacterium]MCB9861285.1 aminotransferase class III-fold pyridoxal phosphate-dependent enzyme [Phycisphaeraceae bacterium]
MPAAHICYSPAATAASTIGAAFASNPAVNASIDAIVEEVKKASAQITDIRPAHDDLKVEYEALLKHAGDLRGRGMYYPYLGSGIGNGALVELADGRVMWDMICGIGVHFFGHSEPGLIRAALVGSLEDTLKHGNLQGGNSAYEFLDVLIAEAKKGSNLQHGFISTSGAMSNENALKICYQKHAPASRVIAFRNCFMGRSVTMAQIGDGPAYRQGIPLSTLVDYMPFYDEAEAKRIGQDKHINNIAAQLQEYIDRYPGQHACFIFELVQGEGGFNVAPREFFVRLMEMCKANGIAVWDDEIQSWGRTESMFAYDALDLGKYVDVFCVGKMTQACATLFTPQYNPKPGLLSGTFTGEGASFRVGQQIIERLRDGNYYGSNGTNAKHHALFRKHVDALAAKHPDWFPKTDDVVSFASGTGGMMRFTPFGGDKEKVIKACKACFDEGVIVFYCGHGPYHVRMLPPLGVMNEADWPRVFACVEKGLARIAGV